MNLMYGEKDPRLYDSGFDYHGVLFNLSTLKEGVCMFKYLLPPREIVGYSDGREFDIIYANYILNNNFAFVEFFSIIYNLYIGKDVYIMSADEDWAENITESLLKLIQSRYGINAVHVDSDIDYIYACNCSTTLPITGATLLNLDQDKERFANFLIQYNVDAEAFPCLANIILSTPGD